jgi:hypothetical protein
MQEVRMTNLMIRIVTLATCSIALIAAFSFTPVVAAGGGGGGGGATYGGMDQRSAYPPGFAHQHRHVVPGVVDRLATAE